MFSKGKKTIFISSVKDSWGDDIIKRWKNIFFWKKNLFKKVVFYWDTCFWFLAKKKIDFWERCAKNLYTKILKRTSLNLVKLLEDEFENPSMRIYRENKEFDKKKPFFLVQRKYFLSRQFSSDITPPLRNIHYFPPSKKPQRGEVLFRGEDKAVFLSVFSVEELYLHNNLDKQAEFTVDFIEREFAFETLLLTVTNWKNRLTAKRTLIRDN